jgi:hypothetical protein
MRTFDDIRREPGFKRFLGSRHGTLYTIDDATGYPRLMVRHFDRDLPPVLIKPYAELIQAVYQWVEARPELARLLSVERPIEVGVDFIARPFHVYYGSLEAYTEWEDPPEPPEELEQMRSAFRAAVGKSTDPRDAIVEEVLSRTLLGLTTKTYFRDNKHRFFMIEPKITREDVERWAALSSPSTGFAREA